MKKISSIIVVGAIAILCSIFIVFPINTEGQRFVGALLTVFAIFFGFYITSYASFSTSEYVASLHKKQDPLNNSKTLLNNLLDIFNRAMYFLLASIVYLISLYIMILVNHSYASYWALLLWLILPINFCFVFQTMSYFIRIIKKSAAQRKSTVQRNG